jgi:aspartate-semialdehyde dehydrogenase
MIELLAETSLPIASVRLLASKRSAGQEIQFKGQPLIVEELVPESFEGIDG